MKCRGGWTRGGHPGRNWYLDLANERDVRDARYVSPAELKMLRELARRLDPLLLVTASFGGHDLTESDVRDALMTAGSDFSRWGKAGGTGISHDGAAPLE